MWFDGMDGLVRVALISVSAYAALILILRVAGKRSLSKLNAFDLVVTVALGSTLATVLLSSDVAMAEGALAFVMLALLQWIVTRLSIASAAVRKLVRAEPRLLARDGAYLEDAMRRERVTRDELDEALRKQGAGRIEDVSAVILETDGSLSVLSGRPAAELIVLRSVQ